MTPELKALLDQEYPEGWAVVYHPQWMPPNHRPGYLGSKQLIIRAYDAMKEGNLP